MSTGKKLKITDTQRIHILVGKICETNMHCLVRLSNVKDSPAIRAMFTQIGHEATTSAIHLSGISNKGSQWLHPGIEVKLEVVGTNALVMFPSQILRKTPTGVVVSIPNVIITMERRENFRIKTSKENMAFICLGRSRLIRDDINTPPVIPPYFDLWRRVSVNDISVGGLSVRTYFPAIFHSIEQNECDHRALLLLPMSKPIELVMQCRWKKKITERHTELINEGKVTRIRSVVEFRLGLSFPDLQEEYLVKIKQFMRKLAQDDGI